MKVLAIFLALSFGFSASAATINIDTKGSTVTWVGKKVTGQHDGTVKIKSGNINLNSKGALTGGTFTLDLTTIANNDVKDAKWRKKLVDHLKSDDFFNVKKHPTAKFTLKTAKKAKGNTYNLTGDLTVKGITHSISFPATLNLSGAVKTAKADFKIDRSKWEIKYNSGKFFDPKQLGDKMIYDDIEFKLDLKTVASKSKKS